jgi:hypothetical protein
MYYVVLSSRGVLSFVELSSVLSLCVVLFHIIMSTGVELLYALFSHGLSFLVLFWFRFCHVLFYPLSPYAYKICIQPNIAGKYLVNNGFKGKEELLAHID